MPLTPTELLIPRVLAIGTEPGTPIWPGSQMYADSFRTGQVTTLSVDGIFGNCFVDNMRMEWYMKKFLMYPNCFRPLEWWEMREPGQMPLYLKHGENGKVRKVKEYSTGEVLTLAIFEGGRFRRLTKEWIPCDESEYLEYQKSKS
jgi:hypothetical protein